MDWAYGVTTVPERRNTLLPRTMASLARAGFDKPRLFVDGAPNSDDYKSLGLEVTTRFPKIRVYGNWILSLAELYIRNPWADRYAIFQDDFVTCLSLRKYLEVTPYPARGYLNLYSFPANEKLAPKDRNGFYVSDQNGKGAVALVFNREAVTLLLCHQHMVIRPQDRKRGHIKVDGGIVETFRKLGWKEFVHKPGLTQHLGLTSTIGNHNQLLSNTFPGEEFDLLQLQSATDVSGFMAEEWDRERVALEQAIIDDRARQAEAEREGKSGEANRLRRMVLRYNAKLKRHLAKKP